MKKFKLKIPLRLVKLVPRDHFALIVYSLIIVCVVGSLGYSFYRSGVLTSQGDTTFKARHYTEAARYYQEAANLNPFDSSARSKVLLCNKLEQSQNSYKQALSELGRKQYAQAKADFDKVVADSPLYGDAKQQALQVSIVIQSLAVSNQHYQLGLKDLAAQQWAAAANELSHTIKLDPQYADAQSKIVFANLHLGVPRIVSATMTKTIGSQGEATSPTATFSPSQSPFFLDMQVGAILKSTKLEYTRYYGSAYVDSGVAYASTDYPRYFSFSWQKSSYVYPKGDYHIKLYLNGYYQTTVDYKVQ
jgi:tetratricopeptide (TPR) repeat protein